MTLSNNKLNLSLYDFSLARGHSYISSSLGSGSVVIDAGAHRAEFSKEISDSFGSSVIALEPNPNLDKPLLGPNVVLVDAALSNKLGTADFILDDNPEASRLTIEANHSVSSNRTINVKTTSLSEIIEDFNIKKIELLKLDVEGAEYDIIQSIDRKLSNIIGQISVEFHPLNPVGGELEKFNATCAHLGSMGFKMLRASYSGYGDVLFLNELFFTPPGPFLTRVLPLYRKFLEFRQRRHNTSTYTPNNPSANPTNQ